MATGDAPRQVKPAGWRQWASGGLSLTVLLTGLFYIQGRAYRQGYLDALGLNESQFPADTPQALWFAFNGWLSGSVRVLEGVDAQFAWYLVRTGLVVLAVLLVILSLILLAHKLDFADKVRQSASSSRWWDLMTSNRIAALYLGTLPLTVLSVFVVPLVMLVLATIIVFAFVVLCLPFWSFGADAARDMCNANRQTVGLATVAEMPSRLELLECGTKYCALIRSDGNLLVVGVDAVERVEVLPVRAARPGETPLPRCTVRSGAH